MTVKIPIKEYLNGYFCVKWESIKYNYKYLLRVTFFTQRFVYHMFLQLSVDKTVCKSYYPCINLCNAFLSFSVGSCQAGWCPGKSAEVIATCDDPALWCVPLCCFCSVPLHIIPTMQQSFTKHWIPLWLWLLDCVFVFGLHYIVPFFPLTVWAHSVKIPYFLEQNSFKSLQHASTTQRLLTKATLCKLTHINKDQYTVCILFVFACGNVSLLNRNDQECENGNLLLYVQESRDIFL